MREKRDSGERQLIGCNGVRETIDIAEFNPWAAEWIKGESVVRSSSVSLDPYEETPFEFLDTYEMEDGFTVEEFVQDVIASDGSLVRAVALRVQEGAEIAETRWSIAEIDARLASEQPLPDRWSAPLFRSRQMGRR